MHVFVFQQCKLFDRKKFKFCANFDLSHQKIDKHFKKYLDKVFIKKDVVLKASPKELICIIPFIGNKPLQLRNPLVNSVENNIQATIECGFILKCVHGMMGTYSQFNS